MSKYKISLYGLLVFCICMFAFVQDGQKTQAGNLVVVLDAGHDDTHAGARGNGLEEEDINLQIALACKQELETYQGVTVYMVRETNACPYGSSVSSSVQCNKKRVDFAKSVGADVYVSLHNNSSSSTAARGAGIYVPSNNYNSYCGQTGTGLANSILNQLLTTGLQNRGISVRYSEDNTRYADGSLADYYAVIKNNKKNGIPAIIVEHAFMSNASDASQFLGSNAKLWTLGILDAKGIAGYYGLQKKPTLDASNIAVQSISQNQNTEYKIKIDKLYGASNVSIAVWSNVNGQDDLHWYAANAAGNGSWEAVVPVRAHASEGIYYVHVYANQGVYVGHTKFSVAGPSIEKAELIKQDNRQGTFTVVCSGVTSGSEIESITSAVWTKENQSDLRWIKMQPRGDGVYELDVNMRDFGYEYGAYNVHTYITDKNGIRKIVNMMVVDLQCPSMALEVMQEGDSAVYRAKTEGIPYGSGIEAVHMELSQTTPDEVETVSFEAVRQQDGEWVANIYPAYLGKVGIYKLTAYGTLSNGRDVLLGETSFDVLAKDVPLEEMEAENGDILWSNESVQIRAATQESAFVYIDPWCDYSAIQSRLYEDADKLYCDFVAYDISCAAVSTQALDISGEAIEAKVSIVIEEISIKIPEYMKGKELTVFYADTSGESPQLTALEGVMSEDGSHIMVKTKKTGVYVLAAWQKLIEGDANFDQEVDLRDVQLVLRAYLQLTTLAPKAEVYCDMDGDGDITLLDIQKILRVFLEL